MTFRLRLRLLSVGLSLSLLPSLALAQTPNDPMFADQWYLQTIAAPSAWDVTTGSSSVIVAVLDTGLDLDHEDIAANLWTNAKEIAENGIDDDKNGYIDDVHGWDFVSGDNDPSAAPTSDSSPEAIAHGTLIAGEIGAVGNNSLGVTGVNWKVKIMPVRMLNDQGSGTEYDAANAIRYAVKNGAKVINLSFAGNETHASLTSAVKDAYANGVVVVAAMGNDSRNTDSSPVYPACLRTTDQDWVIGVTAVDEGDRGTSFTNYGAICADIAAPGTNISGLSYYDLAQGYSRQYYGPWNGTSMASPLVAGAAALLFARYPTLSAGDVRNILKLSVDPVQRSGFDAGALGAGRLNVARALALGASYAPAAPADSSDEAVDETTDVALDSSGTTTDKPTGVDTTQDVLQYSFVAFGAPAGSLPEVDVYRADGKEYARFQAYGSNFRGGVHVATINNDGDFIPEIVTGAGESGGPHVRVFKAFGALSSEFFAYDKASGHGVNIATGDINGDGVTDILTAVGSGVSQDIVGWSERGEELLRFTAKEFPISSPLEVSAVDYDDDDAEEIAVSGLIDGVTHVALYDNDGRFLVDTVPYDHTASLSLSRFDGDGDLYDDLLVAPLTTPGSPLVLTKIGALKGAVTLNDSGKYGHRVMGVDLDIDGAQDILAMENVDGGTVSLIGSDLKTPFGSFTAPTFNSKTGPFLASW
jgi:subtilisin family serine protease